MARLRIKRMSDGTIFSLQMGSIKGMAYKTNGDIDTTQSFPYIEYYGERCSKIINPSLESDTFYLINRNGGGIRSFTINRAEYYELQQGQWDGRNLVNIVKSKSAKYFISSGYLAPAFNYTIDKGFGLLNDNNTFTSYNYDNMFLYDSENDKIFMTYQNEIIYTGGIRNTQKDIEIPYPLSYTWGKGYRKFSDLKYQTTQVDAKYNGMNLAGGYGFIFSYENGALGQQWVNGVYFNDKLLSTLGVTARKPLAIRNHTTGTTSFPNLFYIQGIKLSDWTDWIPADGDDTNINPNDPSDPDNPDDSDYP